MSQNMTNDELDALLRELSDEIDVGLARYQEAERRYKGVAKWLDAGDSCLNQYDPDIFIQGSFALGTATKPFGEDGEFDVDVQCSLRASGIPGNATATQQHRQALRAIVGKRLKEHGTYGPMVQPPEGRQRCWTIQYADGSKFHMDICPSIPEDAGILKAAGINIQPGNLRNNYILLTDNQKWHRWINGNPRDYRTWFAGQMKERLYERRVKVAMEKREKVEDIPEYEARTTLQRAIQILKRHRDIKYEGDDDAPISIIITTLAARAYNNDPNLITALGSIVNGMRDHIRVEGDAHYVDNPVDPRENFANKWIITPRKKTIFYDWLDSVGAFCIELPALATEANLRRTLSESFGGRDSGVAIERFVKGLPVARRRQFQSTPTTPLYPLIVLPPSEHALRAKWLQANSQHTATLRCVTHQWRGFRKGLPINSDQQIPKGLWLNFDISTTVPEPCDVHWQVTNTGIEARQAGQLRGEFYPSDANLGKRKRQEKTAYTGRHWVKAFIVRQGHIMAESEPFVVNIQ